MHCLQLVVNQKDLRAYYFNKTLEDSIKTIAL